MSLPALLAWSLRGIKKCSERSGAQRRFGKIPMPLHDPRPGVFVDRGCDNCSCVSTDALVPN